MSLDVDALVGAMLGAAKGVVDQKWPSTKEYFESEAKAFASRLETVAKMLAKGHITEKRAKQHVAMQKEAFETVLLAVQGLNQLMVEEAVNAAIGAIRDAVNTAVGIALL